jgi:hypothetical protein
MAVQEDHDLPHRLLFGPGGQNAGRTDWPDAIDFAKPVRCGFNDIEDFLAEGAHQLLGVDRANAPNHAGGEVFLDAV